MDTPAFIQLVTTGAGEGYSTHLYGLTAEGVAYKLTALDVGTPEAPRWVRRWVALTNEA